MIALASHMQIRRLLPLLCLLISLLTGCGGLPPTPPPTVSELCRPKDAVALSPWRGIVPGQTGEAEVAAILGEPDSVAYYLHKVSSYHYYPRPGRCGFFTVTVQDGIVQSTTEVALLAEDSSALFATLQGAGCEPTVVEQSISPHPAYAYPELGVAFEVDAEGKAWVEQHFAPRSSADYLAEWSGLDLRLDPSPHRIRLLERLGVRPGVTTQEEVAQMLRDGAQVNGVMVREAGAMRKSVGGLPRFEYDLLPMDAELEGLRPGANIGRIAFKDGAVFTIEFVGMSYLPSPDDLRYEHAPEAGLEIYTFGDALRDYGEPALVFVVEDKSVFTDAIIIPSDLHLVYTEEGRQVSVTTDTSHSDRYCLTLNSAVVHVLYFAPLSKEEFRARLPYIWHEDFHVLDGEFAFIGGTYREIEWQGIASFCEQNGLTECLRP